MSSQRTLGERSTFATAIRIRVSWLIRSGLRKDMRPHRSQSCIDLVRVPRRRGVYYARQCYTALYDSQSTLLRDERFAELGLRGKEK